MDPIWITIAFLLGFGARQIGLPPLVGFLVAGFVLNGIGIEGGETLDIIADLGVTLLLFSIGLKLQIRSLLEPKIWATGTIHMLITVILFGAVIFGLSLTGTSLFGSLDFKLSLLIAFALSFSSTVFAVKVLEEKGEMAALHGRVSIGILIIQDIVAVIFLTFSMGKIPSFWALPLLALLPVIRYLLKALLSRCGHGEVLILAGMFIGLVVGAAAFDMVGLKADLGALIVGMLIADHPKASELAKSLLGFKEIFLVGFFLNIGLSGAPTIEALGIATLLTIAMPIKVALFFFLLTRFKLRARTSMLTSFSLANYSEFGLIVGAVGAANGWIGSEWLVVMAISLSMTFVLAAPLNTAAHSIYSRMAVRLRHFETRTRLPEEEPIDPGDAQIVIFGMGQVGTGAYDFMRQRHDDKVIGIDFDSERVREHQKAGRNVIQGDPTDSDFWERAETENRQVALIMLAMPSQTETVEVVSQLKAKNLPGLITAIARFDDEVEALKEAGVDAAFNINSEAGSGFAEHICREMDKADEKTISNLS
jgi:glutathione-regulated potassium-efflux system ancillary protein KefC